MKNRKDRNVGQSRRQFLKTASKMAVYTPPAMMVLGKPSLAAVTQSGDVPKPVDDQTQTIVSSTQETRIKCEQRMTDNRGRYSRSC